MIFFHELGHFAVAKWCNVLVERFSIGFGPILLKKKYGETEYALSAILASADASRCWGRTTSTPPR